VPYWVRPMLKSDKMHQEHIAQSAQTMKDLYYVRRVDLPARINGDETHATSRSLSGRATTPARNPGVTSRTVSKRSTSSEDLFHPQNTSHDNREKTIPLIRCFRCGNTFPVTNFLHTKKSGLCRSCWEKRPRYHVHVFERENLQKKFADIPAISPDFSH
jgi:hypothetical protein